MFGREAAPPPPVVLSVVDEINYGWTQHLTKSVAYTLPIGKRRLLNLPPKMTLTTLNFIPRQKPNSVRFVVPVALGQVVNS